MANRKKDWKQGLSRWQALEARFPTNLAVLAGLAETFWMLKDEAALTPVLDRLLALEPHNIPGEVLYSRLELRQNKAKAAVARLVAAQAHWSGDSRLSAPLTDARMQALVEDDTIAPSTPDRPSETSNAPSQLFEEFESLGSGCEFGLLQRKFGIEPLGLLRWGNITPEGLISALEKRFEGIGNPETTVIKPIGENYSLMDRRYEMGMQTFISIATESAETLLPKLCKRQRYLARMLMEDMQEGRRILVYKMESPMSRDQIDRLWRALNQYGKNALLLVRLADADHRVGELKILEDGLMIGTVDRFSNSDIAVEAWTSICRAAQEAWKQIRER
jgi:hypothetical protein